MVVCACGAAVLSACGATATPTAAPTPTARVVEVTKVIEKPVTQVVEKPVTQVVERIVTPTPVPPRTGLVRGGQLLFASSYSVDTLFPHISFSSHVPSTSTMFNYLIRYKMVATNPAKFQLVPELAETFGYDNPQTAVFKLRKGIKFHDGTDLNATVVKWNLELMASHPKSLMKDYLSVVDKVEAPDASTVVVRLKKPYGLLFNVLSNAYSYGRAAIISMEAFTKGGEDGFAQKPIGTGPFKFKQRIGDDRTVVEKFPGYWENGEDGKPLPYLDEIVARVIPDLTVATAELAAGTLHAVQELPASQAAAVRAIKHLVTDVWDWGGMSYIVGNINMRRDKFKDIRVRQAINYGIDREGLVKATTFGLGVVAAIPFGHGKGAPGWSEEAENMYNFDPDKAKALLKDAGYPSGFDTSVKTVYREPDNTMLQFLVQQWKKAGINAAPEAMERTVWIEKVTRGTDWDLQFVRYPLPGVEPGILRPNWTCGGAVNYGAACDPVIDDLIAKNEAETDAAKRDQIARELYIYMQKQAYYFNGLRIPIVFARNRRVNGVAADWVYPDFRAAWLAEV